jgi:hypothetical protein
MWGGVTGDKDLGARSVVLKGLQKRYKKYEWISRGSVKYGVGKYQGYLACLRSMLTKKPVRVFVGGEYTFYGYYMVKYADVRRKSDSLYLGSIYPDELDDKTLKPKCNRKREKFDVGHEDQLVHFFYLQKVEIPISNDPHIG